LAGGKRQEEEEEEGDKRMTGSELIKNSRNIKYEIPKCIKCGVTLYSRGTQPVSSEPKEGNLCEKCAAEDWAKLPLSERVIKKTIGYGLLAGIVSYFATTELAIKPAIRSTKKIFKRLDDWAEKR
jgi:hypothetical protein